MINVFIYGLDQFVVGDISRELGSPLAKVFEINEDDLNFVAPNTMVFHNGAEQTSWHVIVEVKAPEECMKVEKTAAEVITKFIQQFAVHVEVTFIYFLKKSNYLELNKEYEKYLEEDEAAMLDEEYSEEINEGEGEDEIYTDDIFAGFDELK